MDIVTARGDLARGLTTVARVIEKRNTIPVLGNVLLTAADDVLTIRGTDLDVDMTARIPAKVMTPGTITVESGRLGEIARKMVGTEVTMALAKGKLTVKSGKSRFVLATLPASDFPNIGDGAFTSFFDVDLAALFEPVRFAVCTEEARYYLNGIFLHVIGADLLAVATDGHRLSRNKIAAPEGAIGMPGVIVPRKAIDVMLKGVATVSISTTKIKIVTPEATLVSKLIDGTFPDYQRVIPTGNDHIAKLNRADFAAAIARVAAVTDQSGRTAAMTFADNAVLLEVNDANSGSGDEQVDAEYAGPPLKVGFNHQYVGDILGQVGGAEVTIALADAGTPGLFTGGGSVTCICMPMRVS